MNFVDIIILAGFAVWGATAVIQLRRKKKKGGCTGCCACCDKCCRSAEK